MESGMNLITKNNLWQYLLNGENETIEFKHSFPKNVSNIERNISALANTKGGAIIFGFDETRKNIVGVSKTQRENLKKFIEDNNFRDYCRVYEVFVEDKVVSILEVKKSDTDVYINDVAYVRSGNKVFSKKGQIRSNYLKEFIKEIQFQNRNPKDTKALEFLDEIETNPERQLLPGTELYRCRLINNMSDVGKETGFFGYGEKGSFVPPPEVTKDMRANYRYIPYLYCANHPYTALVEVRPRLGANVSVATIMVNEEIRLLDFTLKNIPKSMSKVKINFFADLSILFSKPVTSDDDILDYIPTQYIAEYAKYLGYDGIAFRSSLTPELKEQDISAHSELDRYNVVIFNYHKCKAVHSNVVNVTNNYVDCEQTDTDVDKLEIRPTLLDMHY